MFRRLLATAAAAAALQLACAAPASAAPPPIEAYGQLPGLDEVSISPDGTKIAYIAQVGEKRRLGVQTITGQALGAVDLGEAKIREISWIDDKHIVIVRSTTTDNPNVTSGRSVEAYNGQIYNIETRKFATIFSRVQGTSVESIKGSDMALNLFDDYDTRVIDGKRVLLAVPYKTGDNSLYQIDLDTGVGTPFIKKFDNGLVDAKGRNRARSEWRFDEGRYRVVAVEGAGERELFVWQGEKRAVDRPRVWGFGRTQDSLLLAVPEGGEHDTLYEVSLLDGSRTKLKLDTDGDVSPIYHGETGGLLGFTFATGEGIEYVFTDPTLAEAWAAIKAGFKDRSVRPAGWTPNFSKILIRTEGDTDAGTYLMVDRAAGKATKIGAAYPGVPSEAVNEKRWIKYAAADGLEIPAYLTLPRGRDPKGLPLIVLPHGGPASRDYPGFDWWAQALASRGYAVLQPQFRGSDGFGEAFLKAGYGQWGKTMQTDLSDGVRHLAKKGVIDPKRVCIFGWSYGGYAAMAGPTLDPGVYRCAIAGAGVSDLRKMVAWANGDSKNDSPISRYWKRQMGGDVKLSASELDATSPALHADRVDVPFMLMHGRDDTVVPYEQSRLMAEALKKAGKPYEFVTLDGEDHWISKGATRTQMLKESIAFLEKHNPPN